MDEIVKLREALIAARTERDALSAELVRVQAAHQDELNRVHAAHLAELARTRRS